MVQQSEWHSDLEHVVTKGISGTRLEHQFFPGFFNNQSVLNWHKTDLFYLKYPAWQDTDRPLSRVVMLPSESLCLALTATGSMEVRRGIHAVFALFSTRQQSLQGEFILGSAQLYWLTVLHNVRLQALSFPASPHNWGRHWRLSV